MKERGRERKITSAASSIDPAPRGVHTWALWRYVFMDKFSPPWRQLSHFLCKLLQCAVQSSWPIWKWVRALWESGVVLFSPCWAPLWSMSASRPQSCGCAMLCLFPGPKARTFVPGKFCLTSLVAPSPAPSHCISQHVLASNPYWLCGCPAIAVRDVQSVPCPRASARVSLQMCSSSVCSE